MALPFRSCYAAVLAACLASQWCWAQRIVVVSSGDTPPYQQALAGIQKIGPVVEAVPLSTNREPAVAAILAHAGRDTSVVTLGDAAAALVARTGATVPVVNCMILAADDAKAPAPVSVPLDIPLDTQIAWLRRLLPNVRNVGILFDPAQNDRRAAEGAAALKHAGYVPVLEPVTGPTALPNALNRLTNRVDVLLALPDTTVYAREHSRALLLFSFRHQVPIVGPAKAWVKAGALYAVEWDFADLGRYCGSLALQKLAGGKGPLPPAPQTRAVVNMRSAGQLRVTWDAETMRAVDRVHE